ncbi:MAG TPA: magnesium transporter CorA family protein [Streptosporangiaceae bacterium]|nr:magnesium transporter CorA family protein [Streptosporangiaceae bacterium]
MKGTITRHGETTQATQEAIEEVAADGNFFWLDLDLHDPGPDDDVAGLLTKTFHFHPVAVEATERFGQRPRIDEYDGYVHIVTFGVGDDGKSMAEVHCFIAEKFIVSLHRGNCPALATVHDRIKGHHAAKAAGPQAVIFYLIMDTLVDSFFPVLSDLDDAIDDIEGQILKNPTEEQLGILFGMKKEIMTIRKIVTPQRDMIAGLNAGMVEIPGMTGEGAAYYRNLYDHLIRISDQVDEYRDLISGAMDTHLSMVSNRLNVVMKQLAIIATVFLPLGFLTGFFGQNFAWPIAHLQSGGAYFLFLGIGSEVVAIFILFILFKRRGWLGSGPTA